ncbi:MAG: PE-PPE domain-containing protein [Mycobacterium sp.]
MAGSRLKALTTAMFAVVVSIVLVCGQATGFSPLVSLVSTVIGIGGSSDPVSERLPAKLSNTVVPAGDTYIATEYPASLNLDRSLRIGMPVLHQNLRTTSGKVLVAGYSLGALLVEQLKRDIAESDDPPSPLELSFLQIATPFVPNGGIFARFPGLSIPDVVSAMGPGQPTQYDTTYIVNEYDLWGDFPAYFNPVAILNAVLGHEYAHVDTWYDQVDPTDPANHVKEVTDPVTGGTETYILVPASRLPLLGPLRDIAYHLGVSAPAERLLGLIEPLLRVIVDMGYTDRLNLNPEVRTPFSLFTPPHKFIEALNAVPGAVREGLENLVGKKRTPVTTPVPTPVAAAAQSTTEKAPTAEAGVEPEAGSEVASEVEAGTDDGIESPPTVTKKPTRTTVVTPRDAPRSASGGDRTAPKRAEAPSRSSRSGQDSRDRGADAA